MSILQGMAREEPCRRRQPRRPQERSHVPEGAVDLPIVWPKMPTICALKRKIHRNREDCRDHQDEQSVGKVKTLKHTGALII